MKVAVSVGGKWYALQLAEQLQRLGVLHRVVTSYPRRAFSSPLLEAARIVHLPVSEAIGRGLNSVRAGSGDYWKAVIFDRIAASHLKDCDIVIGFASFVLHSMRARRKGCRFVLERACPHIEDQVALLEEEGRLLGMPVKFDPRMTSRMVAEYAEADVIAVPSNYSKRSFLKKGFLETQIRVHPLSGKFPPPVSLPQRDAADPFRLLFIGGSFLRKGLLYLLRAWSELKLRGAELWLRASDGLEHPLVVPFLRDPTVKIFGYRQDLAELYSKASAFCLPSIDDGFGMVVLEAMAYGLPVIVTENVGAADCVRAGIDGLVVPIRDVEALQVSILSLYENRTRRMQMGEAARERSLKYSWDVYGERVGETLSL